MIIEQYSSESFLVRLSFLTHRI